MNKKTPKFESPWDWNKNTWKGPHNPKMKEEYLKRKRETDKSLIMSILYHDPDLLQEVILELRKLKINNII